MSEITFKGDIVTGELELNDAEMVCVPAKEQYNTVDLTLRSGMNIQVAEIHVNWLDYKNKKVLGYEIEKRWNLTPKLIDLLERSICGLEWYKTEHPDSWSKADEEHLTECLKTLN